jgi:hypothetical protein
VLREFDLTPIFEQIDYEAEIRNDLIESELEMLTDVIDVLGIEIDLSEEEWLDTETKIDAISYGRNKDWWEDMFCEGSEEYVIAIKTLSELGFDEYQIKEMLGIK